MISIRLAGVADIDVLERLYIACGKRDDGYFAQCFENGCDVFIAAIGGVDAGLGVLNWSPRYSLYKKLDMPEIQDLNVVPDARGQGIGRFMLSWCEDRARTRGRTMMGISVGLTKDYGPAQILYAKTGYIPDGYGVTCDREAVVTHASYAMNDDLALMLVKQL